MTATTAAPNVRDVADALQDVFDPELGIDVVALGMVYGIDVTPAGISVAMTTTTADCPMGGAILEGAQQVLEASFPGLPIEVAHVFDPPWAVLMCSDDALRWLGFDEARLQAMR